MTTSLRLFAILAVFVICCSLLTSALENQEDQHHDSSRVKRQWGYGGYGMYRPWGMGMYRPWGMGMYRPWGMGMGPYGMGMGGYGWGR